MRLSSALLASAFLLAALGRFRRQPRLHRCQPGRRLWRRPVPGQGREMRRPCRPLLLPVTGICTGHRLSPRRSRRNHRRGSEPAATNAPATAAANTSPSPASARGDYPGDIKGRFATSAPRKRRDAAPRSGYWMRPWPQNAALAARLGFQPRGSALNGRICWKFATLPFPARILTCAVLLGIAAPGAPRSGADERRRHGADEPGRPATAGRAGQSDLHPARRTIGDHRPRRRHRRPRQGRTDPPLSGSRRPSSRPNSIASRMQAKRMGCESSGFFSLFNGQSAQCGPVNNQIQQMRANLDQITTSLERLRSGGIGGADRENQRRSVLTALAQNNCGPQYAAAARGPGNFIDNLFGNNNQTLPPPSADLGAPSGTFRTVCVRTCDGGYFPVSFATVPGAISRTTRRPARRFARRRKRRCSPTAIPARTSTRRSRSTASLTPSLPNAFKFRTEFNPSCACKAAGQTWSEALKSVDDKAGGRTGRHHRHRGEREADAAAARSRRARRPTAKKGARRPPAPAPAAPPHAARRRRPHGDRLIRRRQATHHASIRTRWDPTFNEPARKTWSRRR